jgi:hypothetical protein
VTAKRVYFFSGTDYVRFDSDINGVIPLVYPRSIAGGWAGLFPSVDAAFYRGKGRAYFFSGDQYCRFTVLNNAVDAGYPKPIAGNWPGMAGTGFETGVDAAVCWGNEKVYFFKGNRYLRYDLTADAVDPGYPLPIAGNWRAISGTGFEKGIDAAINYGNGKAYFFRGDAYVRVDLATKGVDAGYPKPIAGNWPGVFTSGISAALEWPHALVAPGGLRAPTGRTGCRVVPIGGGLMKGGEGFSMEIDFVEGPHPVTCAVGEYRQYARGTITVNGTVIAFPLPDPAGGAPLRLLPKPPPGSVVDNFIEDGLVTPGPTANVWYGHRVSPVGNADATDQYLPDRMEGCQYRGTDDPGFPGPPGDTFAFDIDFRADAVDQATSGAVLASTSWTFTCSGSL